MGARSGDLVITGGPIFTSDPARPWATSLAIQNGQLRYVGDDRDAAIAASDGDAPVFELDGRLATAGLIDAHCHPLLWGEALGQVNLQQGIHSVADILERVRDRAEATPTGEWIQGWGYYTELIDERRPPTRQELDSVAPDHPVALRQRSGHETAANSLALKLAGIDDQTPDPVGGRIERDGDGSMTGLLVENAQDAVTQQVIAAQTPESAAADLRRAADGFLRFGITSVGSAHITSREMFQLYQLLRADALAEQPRFSLMMSHWVFLDGASGLGVMTGFGDQWLRLGPMKFFIDGTEGQRTAKVSQPYADQPENTGMWMFPPEEFRERVLRAHLAGWQCATHAIGDAAVELTLDAYREAQEALERPDVRHRVEHASLLRPDLIDRLSSEAVVPVPGARFASNDYPVLMDAFGSERVRWYQPWNSLFEHNVPVCVSSDAPVQSPDPTMNIWAIVNSRSEFDRQQVMQPEERLSLEETLIAYTRHGAYATHEEGIKGMLTPGYLGDITIFDRNLFDMPAPDLDQAQIAATVLNGVIVHQASD